eukprot:298967-Ditylum_brightwellii.AAC.1
MEWPVTKRELIILTYRILKIFGCSYRFWISPNSRYLNAICLSLRLVWLNSTLYACSVSGLCSSSIMLVDLELSSTLLACLGPGSSVTNDSEPDETLLDDFDTLMLDSVLLVD